MNAAYLGYAAGVLSVMGYGPYISAILRDRRKADGDSTKCAPKRAAQTIWFTTSWIIFATMSADASGFAKWQVSAYALGETALFLLAIPYGTGGWKVLDRCCMGASLLGLAFWGIFHSSWYSFLFALFVDGVGVLPIVAARGVGEDCKAWTFFMLGCLANLGETLALEDKSLRLANPALNDIVYSVVMSGIVLAPTLLVWRLTLFRERRARHSPLGTSDKQVAEQKLRDIIREREQEAAGILVPKRLRDAAQDSLADHLQDYIADLTAQKRDSAYIYNVEKRLSKLASESRWKQLRDVTADSFQRWRARQRFAAKTLNDYLAAACAFFRWMECNGRVTCNPLKLVRKVEGRGNERRKRRAFTLEEMNRLLGVSESRRVGYLAAFFTGLRRAELVQLQWGDVHLEADPPFLSARASTTKNHERADIVLHAQLEAELRSLKQAEVRANATVFRKEIIPSMEVMRKDLAAAGIAYKDEQGRQADFHALRGSLCTHLAIHGIDPHIRKEIMRHSELSLTLKNYTDVQQLKISEAIRVLPSFTPQPYAVGYAVNSDLVGLM